MLKVSKGKKRVWHLVGSDSFALNGGIMSQNLPRVTVTLAPTIIILSWADADHSLRECGINSSVI